MLAKYNTQAPRYTSYPAVPYWTGMPSEEKWRSLVKETFRLTNSTDGIALYIHLPFCESLCTYCACNTRITVNHKVETPYIDCVLKEWQMYLGLFGEKPQLRELHLGGGTPTFFSAANLHRLISGILEGCEIRNDHDFSFEGHPANTTEEHLRVLFALGFRRVSFGIQDFDEKVQVAINRHQSFEEVRDVTNLARRIGYTSVNFDLVYGLPFQDEASVHDTVQKITVLMPDRIAFYSYAHVPWLRPGQRKFSEKDLPADLEKRRLYDTGREMFLRAGYEEVGLDHFTLKSDPLYRAKRERKLHRNFMGYTDKRIQLCIGLGASAIGDTGHGFGQNIKAVEPYQEAVMSGHRPVHKGHVLSPDDIVIRQHILELMCNGETSWTTPSEVLLEGIERCRPLQEDGLVEITDHAIRATDEGQKLIRNICMCFDQHYWSKSRSTAQFSSVA